MEKVLKERSRFQVGTVLLILSFALGSSLSAWSQSNSANDIRSRTANEITGSPDSSRTRRSSSLTKQLNDFAKAQSDNGDDFTGRVVGLIKVMNDEIYTRENSRGVVNYLFFENPLNELMDAMVRRDGKYPVVIGGVGSGKTALIESLIKAIESGQLPDGTHLKELENRVFLKTSARNFIPGGTDLKAFIAGIKFIATSLKIKPVLVINDAQFLTDYHFSVLVENAPYTSSMPIILEADERSYVTKVSPASQFQRYATPIRIKTPSKTEMVKILKDSGHLKAIKDRYSVSFEPDAIDAAVEVAGDYRLEVADPARTLGLLEAMAIQASRENNGSHTDLSKVDVFKFVAKATGVPVVPQDRENFMTFMQDLRTRVLAKVRGQDHIVNGMIDQFQAALTSRGRKHSIAMVMGPTGVGKTYGAEVLAQEFYGNKERILKLDMTQFQDEHQINVLFGAPNGYVSSQENRGTLCEFLDGAGKGGGIIIMDEFEEAHSKVVTRMMEMFDQGFIRGGDGKLRYLGRSLIIMTSNKQSDKILPSARVRGMGEAELDRVVAGITQEQMKRAWTEKSSYTEKEGSQVKAAVMERIDKFYYAKPLLQERAEEITDLEVEKYIREQALADDVKLEVDPSFAATLTGAFYNEENGARQLRAMVQQTLSRAIQEYRKKFGASAQDFLVTANLHPSRKTESFITVSGRGTSDSLTIDGPKIPVTNKLFDPEFRQRIQDLDTNLKSEIYGQDEAVQSIVGAAKSRYLKADNKKAVAGFLIGTTGTGKTQLGKSTAKFLFGRPDAIGLFEMGNVNDEHDLANILSPPKGIIGSNEPGQLEAFLNKFPDGGVLMFDEMSNAGKNNPALKNSIYKQFYGMLEEGVYKTPSGKVYDLTKYLILFTGNDGEQVFKGLSSDSMIDETYTEATKNPETVKDLLRQAGAPDAFLGRLAFVTLMRPATSKVKALIADKMLREWVADVQKSQPFDIVYDSAFVEEVSKLMFSPQSGARAIVQFLDTFMGRLVADSALKFDWEVLASTGQRGKLALNFEVVRPSSPFYTGDKPDETKAVLNMKATLGEATVTELHLDVTHAANFGPQVHIDDARATAYHEMGHMVTSFTEITGKKPVKITIVPERIGTLSALGYAQYREVPVKGHWTRDRLIHYIAGLMAGSEAETMFTGNALNAGRSNDMEKAGSLARKITLEHHLIRELDTAHAYVDEKGNIVNNLPQRERDIFDNFIRAAMNDARKLALKTLNQKRAIIEAGVEHLVKHGNINEHEIEALMTTKPEKKSCASLLSKIFKRN